MGVPATKRCKGERILGNLQERKEIMRKGEKNWGKKQEKNSVFWRKKRKRGDLAIGLRGSCQRKGQGSGSLKNRVNSNDVLLSQPCWWEEGVDIR